MPLLRGPDGFIVNVDDAHAGQLLAGGYTPVNIAQTSEQTAAAPRNETGGVLGAVGATASSALSGVTLGGSDWALKGLLDDRDFERLANDRRAHPLLSGGGQIAGAIAATVATGGAATPAGALGRVAAEGIEAGKVAGGAAGLARQLAYAGGEGALQNAGIYLSDVALGDRDLTAEGINGALGTGMLLGAAGIPVAHGIEAGTVAARRMFARYAQGGAQAASDAAAAWTEQAQRHLEAFDQAADLAKARLAEAQAAREQTNLGRLRANAEAADARAFTPPQEFPGAPTTSGAAGPEVPGSGATAGGTAASAPVPGEPPEVAMARALRDRAQAMGGEPITPGEIPPGAPGFRRRYVIPGERPPAGPNAIELLAQQPGVTTAGPATAVREYGMHAVPVTADEAELGARVAEYTAARRAFDELHAQVDPDLDALLRGIEPVELQRPTVPIGEFGAPGARGFKSQDTLARIAAGTGREEVAQAADLADVTGAGGPRAIRAQGTPAGRSLGEVAAEQAPVPIEQPATAVGKRPAAASAPAEASSSAGGRIEVKDIGGQRMQATMPDGSKVDLGTGGAEKFLEQQMPPGFHPAKVATHRDFVVEHGLPKDAAEVAQLDDNAIYVAKPSELAERGVWGDPLQEQNVKDVLKRWKDGETLRPVDAYVTPEGRIYIEDGNHRIQAAAQTDRPVAIRFRDGTGYDPHREAHDISARIREDLPKGGSATAAGDDLLSALHGTAAKVDEGQTIGRIGADSPARAEYVTARAERQKSAAEHFRAEAIAKREARAAAVAQGETPNPFHEPAPTSEELDSFFKSLTAPKTRDAYVAANIGRAMREEGSHAAALAKVEREWGERMAESGGHPLAVKQLEMAHDAALERAATAADPAERAAAAQEAAVIEKQMTQVGARPGAVEDVAALAPAVTRVEKAAAALTEALGDAAPAAAKEHVAAFRAAEDEASRKTTARIGQAADDAASARSAARSRDPLAPPPKAGEDLLGGPGPRQRRIAAAQKSQREAQAAYAKAQVAEAEAKIGAKQAAGAAADARAKLGLSPAPPGAAARGHGIGARVLHGAHVLGYAAELGSDLGIPGIPRPHDIPVIGPLLSAYLKYRALRAAAGRFVGRIPATAETRAAELAARTRDGVARAVDRTLGLIERNTNTVRAVLTVGTLKATDALSKRLIDDGGPDAKAGASVSEQAAVRMREIAAAATNPALITQAVRAQTRGMTDPDLIDALSNHLVNMFQYLNSVAPKGPPPNPFTGKQWTPSQADAIRFGQQVAIAKDPQVAFQMLDAGTLTPAGAATLQNCYRLLFQEGQQRVIQRAAELKNPVAYPELLRLGRLFDIPVHPSLEPENAAALAAAHTPAAKPAPAAAPPSAPPTPSIANPTNLSSLYDAGGARRAGRM